MEWIGSRFKKLHRFDLYVTQHTAIDKEADSLLLQNLLDICPSLRIVTFARLYNAEDSWIWTWGQSGLVSHRQISPTALFWAEGSALVGV
jgi:hypothetical protein